MANILKVGHMRDLESQVIEGKITYGRMLELIEAKVLEQCILKADLLVEIHKKIDYNNDNKDHVFGKSQMWTGNAVQKAIVFNLENISEWVSKYKPERQNSKDDDPLTSKTPKDHISKADLMAQIETTSNAMKGVAYNEDIGEITRKQAYDRFAALEWLKDWVPHLANMSNAENGHIKAGISESERRAQYENMPNLIQEMSIAVVAPNYRDFEYYVGEIYKAMPKGKSIVSSHQFRWVEIEGKSYKSKYYYVNSIEDTRARVFDAVEKAHSFGLMENGDELLHFCLSRIKDKTHHWKRTKSEISPKEWKANHEKMANEMRAAQMQPVQMQCPKCFTKWNIETPALYKETFCPKCGE